MLNKKDNKILHKLKVFMIKYQKLKVKRIYKKNYLIFRWLKTKFNKFKKENIKDLKLNQIEKIYKKPKCKKTKTKEKQNYKN